jgi:flavin-binding protein dodecin
MGDSVFRYLEMVGTSSKSVEDAVQAAVTEAGRTEKRIYWFEVKEIRGRVDNGSIAEYQVSVRLGCKSE